MFKLKYQLRSAQIRLVQYLITASRYVPYPSILNNEIVRDIATALPFKGSDIHCCLEGLANEGTRHEDRKIRQKA